VEVLGDLERYPAVAQPEEGVTYAPKVDKAETRLEFTRPALEVERQGRAFSPTPGAWFEVGGERVKVLAAEIPGAPSSPVYAELVEAPSFSRSMEEKNSPSTSSGRTVGLVFDDQLTIACAEGAIRPT
ncbi:hypothetical protein LH612_36425, partial [Klebsiella pneumoniae]|nr:hypothetical protein [Klebsiella pneumoniae]